MTIKYSLNPHVNPLAPTAAPKYYPSIQMNDVVSSERFAEHLASHGSKYDEFEIAAILGSAIKCLRRMLLEGRKVELPGLGWFSLTMHSKGVSSPDKFNEADILDLNVRWDPSDKFQNLRDANGVQFELVSSRLVQKASLKAEKEGNKSLDIQALKDEEKAKRQQNSTGGDGVVTID